MFVRNQDQRSKDYSNIMDIYRPGHADYTFDQKYGFRDYRGGGRSSGRETIGRVAAGAVAAKFLESLGITIRAFSKSIGPVSVSLERFDWSEREKNRLYMPDAQAAKDAEHYLEELMKQKNSAGGVIQCEIDGLPTGIGEPVFDKLNASLAKAVMSIGAVKGFEIGDGFQAASSNGKDNNDPFCLDEHGQISKKTNHSGGILGGISDGSKLTFRAAFKPDSFHCGCPGDGKPSGTGKTNRDKGPPRPDYCPQGSGSSRGNGGAYHSRFAAGIHDVQIGQNPGVFCLLGSAGRRTGREIIEEIQEKKENESYENCNGK